MREHLFLAFNLFILSINFFVLNFVSRSRQLFFNIFNYLNIINFILKIDFNLKLEIIIIKFEFIN